MTGFIDVVLIKYNISQQNPLVRSTAAIRWEILTYRQDMSSGGLSYVIQVNEFIANYIPIVQ